MLVRDLPPVGGPGQVLVVDPVGSPARIADGRLPVEPNRHQNAPRADSPTECKPATVGGHGRVGILTVSTIGEEKAFNPRLQVKSIEEYVDLMNNLKLANPKMMDIAVPANVKVGLAQEKIALRGWAVTATQALAMVGKPEVALIDLRERSERERHGTIPGSLHVPYPSLQENISDGGMLHELAKSTNKRLLFYCAFGERSAMAVQAAQDAGLASACHIQGGIDAWKKASGPLSR